MAYSAARNDRNSSGRMMGLIACCAVLSACVAAAPMAAPVAGDVAGSAVEKSGDIAKAGKVETDQPVPIDDVIAVARRAAGELDLKQVAEEKHPDQLNLIYRDQRKQDITVTLVRRTYKASEIHVDVGLFGDTGMGQLMLRQILHDLPPETGKAPPENAASDKATPLTDANAQARDPMAPSSSDAGQAK